SYFFFSSRRRHTRSKRDWSSDVCSSDLGRNLGHVTHTAERALELVLLTREHEDFLLGASLEAAGLLHRLELLETQEPLVHGLERSEERRVGKEWGAAGGAGV